jgi:hypothetical protein
LGEKEHWGKHTPWQRATRAPIIIVPPKNWDLQDFTPETKCPSASSLMDLYPTLIEMCDLPNRTELEGQSLYPLMNKQNVDSKKAVVTTIGRGNHSICTEKWSYIHYFDGSEELYDLSVDPNEWFNLAYDPKYSDIKETMAHHIPVDPKIKQFIRWGHWKAVIRADDTTMLFDIEQMFGISEQFDVCKDNPSIVKKIRTYLNEQKIKDRYVTIPDDA